MNEQIEQCPSCTRNKYNPFRRYSKDGKIVAGCIDDFHTGHLTPISQSNSWHNRSEAKKWRRVMAKHLKLVTGRKLHDYSNCQCFAH